MQGGSSDLDGPGLYKSSTSLVYHVCKLGVSALTLAAVFSPGQEMRHGELYILDDLIPTIYLPEITLILALKSVMPAIDRQ